MNFGQPRKERVDESGKGTGIDMIVAWHVMQPNQIILARSSRQGMNATVAVQKLTLQPSEATLPSFLFRHLGSYSGPGIVARGIR